MTTLRETLAKALYAADLSEKSQPCGAAATYPMLADAVLRALAEWEPSDAFYLKLMRHTYDTYSEKDRAFILNQYKLTTAQALRAMAEET